MPDGPSLKAPHARPGGETPATGAPVPPAPAAAVADDPHAAPRRDEPLSITDFLTDGSLPATCEALSRLTGVGVTLVDPAGRVIAPDSGPVPWRILDAESPLAPGSVPVPLDVDGRTIASIIIDPAEPIAADGPALREALASAARTWSCATA
jgi:hypothetical protein